MRSSLNKFQLNEKPFNMIKLPFVALLTTSFIFACSPAKEDVKVVEESKLKVVESGVSVQDNLPSKYLIGEIAAKEVIAGWDIEIRPDGLGLPVGSGSVEDGESLYEEKCAMCHGTFGEGVDQWPKLSGGEDSLTEPRPEKTVGSFWPYASTLWDYINRAMPYPAPQSLEADEVYAITAYVLSLNEIVEDDFVLTKENFASVEMPNKDGFYLDDRPDTQNTRCMKDCKDPASINVILGPEYSLGKTEEASGELQPTEANKNIGEKTYENACQICHATGVANAPKIDNSDDWEQRLTQSKDTIYSHALNGLNGMPAKGGRMDLSDESVKAAVDYMLEQIK